MLGRATSAQDATDLSGFRRATTGCELHPTSSPGGNVQGKIRQWEVGRHYTIMPGRLSFAIFPDEASMQAQSRAFPHLIFFTSREQSTYHGYCSDFGPSDISSVVSFCVRSRKMMEGTAHEDKMLVHASTLNEVQSPHQPSRPNPRFC